MSDKMFFKGLLQKDGWLENVEVVTDQAGVITAIEHTHLPCTDYALPGFYNAHSHAFQYAMAGTAENHTNPDDDFWSWREAMYKLALEIDPDQIEAIAAMAYSEMLRHGYTHVAEFHYLHNDKDGRQYGDIAETGKRLVAAAARAGINITLTPVYYKSGGFGKPAADNQRRFTSNSADDFLSLVEASARACEEYPNARIGFGVHSLRAAPLDDMISIVESGPQDAPFHMHIAEQVKEVDDCMDFYGARPVEFLFDSTNVDERFNLVHVTHAVDKELNQIAQSGANAVICPTTEGNLGDGIFPLKSFRRLGGRWSIGTDSHVSLNPFEEFRLLDYGQRLVARSRNTFGENGSLYAVTAAFDAGRQAMGKTATDFFTVGEPLNACLISSGHPLISSASRENRLNTIVYASDESMQLGSIVNGVRSGESNQNDEIRDDFLGVLKYLRDH